MEEDGLEDSTPPLNALHSEITVSVTGEPPSAVEEKTEIEVTPEIIEQLSLPDVLRISAVLEDTTVQLSILNYIMPVQYEGRQSSSKKKNKEMDLEGKNLQKVSLVSKTKLPGPSISKEESQLSAIRNGSLFAKEFNKMQDLVFQKPVRQTIMSVETMKKIQIDREFFSEVIIDTMEELQDTGTFTNLLNALNEEREKKMHFYDIIAREENGKKQIKSLQKQHHNVKREWQVEIQNQNEYIAHLKDQLQEMKAKTNMENCYMKINTELQVSQTQKKCNKTEEQLLEEAEKLRLKIEEENRTHTEIEMFLKKEQQKLEEKLEFWMEKFDKDTEMKQNELNALKTAKAIDLSHLQDLAKMIREYEQVIIEDRIEKEKLRKKIDQDELELKSIIKLQAWWRGTMVRREIGAFKLPKKDKENGKDSKGKGKGKAKDKRRGKK
ncbi:dynein regulatory complex protein 9 isoform X1 [Talpa occidentalis]|uniref:dynein regulatory complex protein 9 isoform X1 n=1 Tax=Talpa occidentalis TaxID=50954 RepID=UPI00188F9E13|nr:dynein regulatory complex protein 9 isoform X1 [Talpa occidentalis]XP_054556470.1 dynein regulatory complex protein 9 isoform X1 [Talpa occidentalis]